MASYSDIQTKVQRRVIDLPTAVTAEVPDLVNWALLEIQRQHNFNIMRADVTYTTVAATRDLGDLPTDFKQFRGLPFYTNNDGSTSNMALANSLADVHLSYDDATEGPPSVLMPQAPETESGTTPLHVWPLPDDLSDYSDGEYRITVPYWKYLTALSSASQSNWFTNNAEMYLVFRATAEAFDINHDDANFAKYVTKANAEFAKVMRADKLQSLLGVDTLVPRYRGARQGIFTRR